MQKFVIGVIVGVLQDERVQAFLIKAAKAILGDVIAEKLLPLFPFALGSAVKQFGQLLPNTAEVVEDAMVVANNIRDDMNQMIPDVDTGFKPLDDLLDAWRPRG